MKKILFCLLSLHTAFIYSNYSHNVQQYMLANYYDFDGKMNKADKLFALNDSVYTYKGRIHHWYKKGEYQKIADVLPKIEGLFNKDSELQLIIVNTLNRLGRTEDAYTRLVQANKLFPSDPQITFTTVSELIKRKELKNALYIIDKMLNNAPKKPNFFVFHFLKGQIYSQLGDHAQALDEVKKSLDMHPRFTKGWLLFALLQEQAGSLKDAIKGYTSFLELTGSANKQIANHLMQLVVKDKLMQENKRGFVVNGNCFSQAITLFKQKQYNRAINYIDQCIIENPKNAKAKLFKIQILTAAHQLNHAAAQLHAWIKKEPDADIWHNALHLLIRLGAQPETIIKTFQTIEKSNPDNRLTTLYLADLYTRMQENQKAIEYLTKSLNQVTNPSIKTKILFQLGLLYFEQKDYQHMLTVLEQAYALNTNYPPLLNLLAHYYATKGKNLVYAQKLINDALAQDKNNIHFIDTQALIYYKQHQYTKAHALLVDIAEQANDATILLHLAKTEYHLKNTNNARSIVKQAERIAQSDYEKQKINELQKKLVIK